MIIRKATKNDYDIITKIEDKSFGVHIIRKELELIIEKGWGDIFLAYDQNTPIAYFAVLYKEYDKEVESQLQPTLQKKKSNNESVMHDDVTFDENKYIYLHLLGVIKDYQNKKVGREL